MVRDALADVVRFVPSLLLFIVILLIGWAVAVALRELVRKLLAKVGFDRLADRGGVGRALSRARFDAGDLVAKLVYYAVLLFTLQIAFGVWGPNPVSDLIDDVVSWLPKAAVAVVIVVVAAALAGGLRDVVTGALGGLPYGRLLANLGYCFVLGLGVIAALNQIGIATSVTTPVLIAVLATIAGILIVGVGGGLVRPMQQRWEGWLSRVEQEAPAVSERVKAHAQSRREEAAARRAAEEAARQAEAEREAEAARQAEAVRQAEEARQARLRQAAANEPSAGVDAPTMVVPTVPPAVTPPAAVTPQPANPPAGGQIQVPSQRPVEDADQTVVINPPPRDDA
ncbi:hypothetical protein AB0J72_01065 [Dactylosporangium sp. NPDC049742]|uniref:mechanosensitive ion channel family protein n=1 Tax=Dactylosporangium sp. NPDC049742 TaxID=3154737 RepID=UPI003442F543